METSLLESLTIDFPLVKENANKLIKEYGSLSYAIALRLYRIGFDFSILKGIEVKEALNINIRYENAVDEIVRAKAELEKLNNRFPDKCTDEELNSFLIYTMDKNTDIQKRMLMHGIPVVNNRGETTGEALKKFINISDISTELDKHIEKVTKETANMALSIGCNFEGAAGELKDIAKKNIV